MIKSSNDRRVVAWAVGANMPRIHALLDMAIYENFTRLTKPIERIAAPGIVAGWATLSPAPSSYAPSLPPVVELVIPQALSDGGELTENYQWRSQGVKHMGWAVVEARFDGPWVPITTAEAELARHGFRWMQEPEDVDELLLWADQIQAMKAAILAPYTLTDADASELDAQNDFYYGLAGTTLDGLRAEHSIGSARFRLMKRLEAAEGQS